VNGLHAYLNESELYIQVQLFRYTIIIKNGASIQHTNPRCIL